MSTEREQNTAGQMERAGLQLLKHGGPNTKKRKAAEVFMFFYKNPALNKCICKNKR